MWFVIIAIICGLVLGVILTIVESSSYDTSSKIVGDTRDYDKAPDRTNYKSRSTDILEGVSDFIGDAFDIDD